MNFIQRIAGGISGLKEQVDDLTIDKETLTADVDRLTTRNKELVEKNQESHRAKREALDSLTDALLKVSEANVNNVKMNAELAKLAENFPEEINEAKADYTEVTDYDMTERVSLEAFGNEQMVQPDINPVNIVIVPSQNPGGQRMDPSQGNTEREAGT